MPNAVSGYQIYFNAKTKSLLDPVFLPLDNRHPAEPGWYEYQPMRKFLAGETLDEGRYYGFFSPRFRQKTGLTGRQVVAFASGVADDPDVITFSPLPCYGSCFVNVFEQADFFSPGLYADCAAFFRLVDPGTDLSSMVNTSRDTVFCNYFLAKPRFWRAWMKVLDLLFEQSTSTSAPLYGTMNRELPYMNDDGVVRPAGARIFVMERAASFLLARDGEFSVANYPPFEMPPLKPFENRIRDLVMLDGLKQGYRASGDARELRRFKEARDRVIESVWPSAPPRLFSARPGWLQRIFRR